MSPQRDPDTILAAWLDEGPAELPDVTRRAILGALPTTPQARRGPLAPRRFFPMSILVRATIAVAATLVVVAGGFSLLGGRPGVGGASPSPAATPRQLSSPMPEPPLGGTFTSSLYDYIVHYPSAWRTTPATRPWTKTINSSHDHPYWGDAALDTLQGSDIRLVVWAQPIPQAQGLTQDQATGLWVRNLGIGNGMCVADSQLPPSFTVGAGQGYTIVNGCGFPPSAGRVENGVLYEVAVVLNGVGWDFTFDGRVDAPYVMRVLNAVVLLRGADVTPPPS